MQLKKYDLSGAQVGHVEIEEIYLQQEANSQMIKDYIVAIRKNCRQWSANTKVRSEVNHSHQKPHRQKGLGRARQGCLAAPQYRGGGRVFGPRPKFDQHVRINKKERQSAVRFLLSEKIKSNQVSVLDIGTISVPKTKLVRTFLRKLGLLDKRVLFLSTSHAGEIENFMLSMRNLEKKECTLVPNLSGYDLALNHDLVLIGNAFDEIKEILGKGCKE